MLRLLIQHYLRVYNLCLKHPGSDESDESDEEEFYKLGSGSGSFGTCGIGLDGLLHGVELFLGVKFAGDDKSFGGGGCGG